MHPTHSEYVEANRVATDRLLTLVESLSDDDLDLSLDDGWTIGAALAHLAYWDRRYAELLARNQRGEWAPDGYDMITDVQNDALLPEWRLLPAPAVRDLLRQSTAQIDDAIRALPEDVVAQILERGEIHLLRRSRHRFEHIDQIEAALDR